MITGTVKAGVAGAAANEGVQSLNHPYTTGGESGGAISQQKDSKESAAAPKFGDIYKEIQAKYGEKPAKPREIKKTLGKDDFLKIMMTQMKNQDPTNPFKAEQMAAEIAQFTSVEQLQNVNQNLIKMSSQNKPLEQMSMTNLIGKFVTVDRQRFPHIEGESESLNFSLSRSAGSVQVSIEDEAGEAIFQKDLGKQNAGEVNFSWDGVRSNTLPAKAGNYRIKVEAKDDAGRTIDINPQVHAKVIGVSFEGSEPVFLVGDAKHQDKITMRNIVRVETDTSQDVFQKKDAPPSPHFFSFQKGVSSVPIEPSALKGIEPKAPEFKPPESNLSEPKPLQPKTLQAKTAELPAMDLEKGFPNGLSDSDEPRLDLQKANLPNQKGGEPQ